MKILDYINTAIYCFGAFLIVFAVLLGPAIALLYMGDDAPLWFAIPALMYSSLLLTYAMVRDK